MRRLFAGIVLLAFLGLIPATAQRKPAPPVRSEMSQAFGDLPKPGDLADILSCAGANEVLWTTAMKEDPRDPEAHEAKRKAGWYSAVALWVFEVDSMAVIDAVKSASQRNRAAVFSLARRCRKAPDSWRE